MRGILANLALALGATVVAALAGEAVLRLRLDEVDYLQPQLRAHPVLRHAIVPGTGHHDAWGFRNPRVPDHVEWLAIGDSQTYGLSAPADEAWPAWLARLSGRSVYNLSLGGYGPPDYRYLLEEYGLSLEPRAVVVGFYFGNDLPRAGDVAKGKHEPSPALEGNANTRALGRLRTALSRHSMLYQVVKYELSGLVDRLRYREALAGAEDGLVLGRARTVLTPEQRFGALDQSLPANRLGLAATLDVFVEIQADCDDHGIRCLYLLIPTKESVYAELASQELDARSYSRLEPTVREEEAVRRQMVAFLQERGLEVVDPLPALREAAARDRIYPGNADGHPNGEGYRVIAGAVLARLEARTAGAP